MNAFDRFAGVRPRPSAAPDDGLAGSPDADRQAVRWSQQRLVDLGFEPGPVDGRRGPATEAALGRFSAQASRDGSELDAMGALLVAAVAPTAVRAGWAWPLPGAPNAPITSPFCWRNGRHHDGIDIGASRGTAIGAARAGRVIFAGVASGYGNLAIVGHGAVGTLGRVHSYYAHMLRIRVRVGQQVAQLHRVGDVDSTGVSTGDHLHFEIRANCAEGQPFSGTPQNPCAFLARC